MRVRFQAKKRNGLWLLLQLRVVLVPHECSLVPSIYISFSKKGQAKQTEWNGGNSSSIEHSRKAPAYIQSPSKRSVLGCVIPRPDCIWPRASSRNQGHTFFRNSVVSPFLPSLEEMYGLEQARAAFIFLVMAISCFEQSRHPLTKLIRFRVRLELSF